MESEQNVEAINKELANIVASEQFRNAARLCKFLQYVVAETLDGNASRLKAFRIAVDVYNREDFDSQDPYIRNVAKDTRRALSSYYDENPTSASSVRIEIPKGKYIPHFQFRETGSSAVLKVEASNKFIEQGFKPTIAVIPLQAMRCGESSRFIGEIFADDLINKISGHQELNVISRLSTTAFAGIRFDMSDVQQQLSADYLVSGTFSMSQDRVKINVELADTKSGFVVYSEQIHLTLNSLMNADEQFVQNIVNNLSSSITQNEIERAIQHNPLTLENHTLLISAIQMLHRITPSDFQKSKELLDVLVERNIRSPLPHAWAAKWHVLNHVQGNAKDIDVLRTTASDCTKMALDLDSRCALALTIDGLVHTNILKQLDIAETRYNDALLSNPSDSLARALKGTLHAFRGEGKQALEDTELALKLSPLDPMKYYYLALSATAALAAEQYDIALRHANQSLKLNPYHASTLRAAAVANVNLDDLEAAKSNVAQLLRLDPEFTVDRFCSESPSSEYNTGKHWAKSLKIAGVPQ